jgi:hypothetical protein
MAVSVSGGGINSGKFEYTAINGGMSTNFIALHWTIKNPLSQITCGFLYFFASY